MSNWDATTALLRAKRLSKLLGGPLAAVGVSLFIVGVDNRAFWEVVFNDTALDEHRIAIVASMFAILFCTLTIALSLAVGVRFLKFAGACLLLVAAACGFFMSEYGIVIDPSMIRSIAATEVREAAPLLTGGFFAHLLAYGALPALLLVVTPFGKVNWKPALAASLVTIAVSATVLVSTLYANYGSVSFFAHTHHSARLLMNPGYPIYAAARYVLRADETPPAAPIALDATISDEAEQRRPTLMVLIVGETARADRFSRNGYERNTNVYTQPLGVVNFGQVSSCGTSTADSVPCLFSHLGRQEFTHAEAATYENLFATLQRVGVESFWRDNSTGCKSVCDPESFAQFATRADSGLCDATGCFDEVLLEDAENLIADRERDHFIVLHQRGSHGPAYHTDTPGWSKRFMPECDLPNLRNCDLGLINNAYDNTILYTDYFLSRVIEFLKSQTNDFDVAMLYVSDHGESLGENGLYLHGFPYAIAPPEQTRVPMMFWASRDFYKDKQIDPDCLGTAADRELSHDVIFHSVLPLFRIETTRYERELDLFAQCRRSRDRNSLRTASR